MALTYLHDTGSWEHFDKTLEYNIETNWTAGNTNSKTPVFKSATGTNVSHSWESNYGVNSIHFNEDEMALPLPDQHANGDSMQGFKTLVYVDIFASDANNLKLFTREVNRILWDTLAPNSSSRITKSDGSSVSPIDHFDRNWIVFQKVRTFQPQMKLKPHAAGVIGCIWYGFKS